MSYFGEVALGSSFQPFAAFQEQFGFVPKLFRAQTLLPRAIEAEGALISAILFTDKALARTQKECILLMLAAAEHNSYCFSLHYQTLKLLGIPEQRLDRIATDYRQGDLSPTTSALLTLVFKLGTKEAITEAAAQGLSNEAIFEAILTAGLSRLLCALAKGVGALPDFKVHTIPPQQPNAVDELVPPGPSSQPQSFLTISVLLLSFANTSAPFPRSFPLKHLGPMSWRPKRSRSGIYCFRKRH